MEVDLEWMGELQKSLQSWKGKGVHVAIRFKLFC